MSEEIPSGMAAMMRQSLWQPTQQLRFYQGSVHMPKVLQQLWTEKYSAESQWRDVPTHIANSAHPK